MSGIRFLKNLKTPRGEPIVYINIDNEGWFSLRQIGDLFFPDRTEDGLQLLLWSCKYAKSGAYYNTALADCTYRKLYDYKILRILHDVDIDITWIVDVHSVQNILLVMDPQVRASLLLPFYDILKEMLKRGGRKRAVSNKERLKIAASQEWKCKLCPKDFSKTLNFEIDHIFRWGAGGSNRRLNLHALCPDCHALKTDEEKHRIFQAIC